MIGERIYDETRRVSSGMRSYTPNQRRMRRTSSEAPPAQSLQTEVVPARQSERHWPYTRSGHFLGTSACTPARLEFRTNPRTNSAVHSPEPVGSAPDRWRSDRRCIESGRLAHSAFARIFRLPQVETRHEGSPP